MKHTSFPIDKRNTQLHTFFESLGYNVKIIGNRNQPKVIIDDSFAISGFVKNNEYLFTTKPFHGDVITSVNIYESDMTRLDVDRLIAMSEKRRLWKLLLVDHTSEESSYNMFYSHTSNGISYFSDNDPKFFFNESDAISTRDWLTEKYGYVIAITSEA